MGCEQCGHENLEGSKFCSECGAPLAATCGSCGADQPAGAKFCNQCGSSLSNDPTKPIPAPLARSDGAARKQVTAVFADLAGSTAFGEQLDPEAAREALAPYFELLQSTIEDHLGTVAKFMGDGMMALFGVPEVAEDDALRAVNAGVELQTRFRAFAERVRDRHGVELGLRVGVNSGELVIADGDADIVGDVLNTAARLESSCTPGRVLVGEDTWRLTRSGIRYEVMGEVRVKGKADPVAAFQVADTEAVAIEENIPFVGRTSELDELMAAFAVTRDSPTANLVTIVGAAGVGKTRLAYELRAATEARSFDLRFERRGSTTFSPIAELLRDITDGSAEGVERLLADHPEQARLVPVAQSFLGIGEPRSTEESFWAVRRLLEHLTVAHGPIIVVVDDIQWAEPLFWDLLDHLVEWTEAPVMLVALARPELRELRPELTQQGRRVAVAIGLEGLDESATRELAARLLETDELPGELIERIPDTTEGNPLFIRELVQMLIDDGTLARDGDYWRLTIDADAIEVPPTILSLLASRVERLPDDERQVIELGSVIGTEFDRGTLTAIAPADVATRLGALVDRLRRKDLIEPSGAWAGDHPVYRFHHVLVRDAAYRRLLKGRRADLHQLVGRHLIDTATAGDDQDVTVAHHFEQAHGFRRELGADRAELAELATIAVERLQRAADEALAREDLPAAGGYAQRAVALVGDESAERDELLLLGCEALLASGDVNAAVPLVRELHERSSTERLAAWADCFRAQLWSLTDPDRLTEAADAADVAATHLAEIDDQAGVAKARLVRAECLAGLGQVGECEAELDQALGAARAAGDRRRTVAVLGAAPLAALWGPSPVARAGGRCLDVLRLLRITTAAPAVEATSVRCQGVLEALRGRLDSARDKLEQSRTTARDLGLRQGLYETELFAGFVEMWAGDPIAAEPHLRAARDGLGQLGIGADAGQAGALLARSLLLQGQVDEAERLAQIAVETAGENLQTAMSSRAALAEIRAAQGRHDEATTLIAEAIEVAERTDVVLDHAMVLLAAARVAAVAGDDAGARGHTAEARRLLGDKGAEDVTPEPITTAPTRPTSGETWPHPNAASDVAMAAFQAYSDLDESRAIELRHPDFRGRLHSSIDQTVFANTEADRSKTVRSVLSSAREAGSQSTFELIAVRDDACLLSSSLSVDGFALDFFHVVAVRDGLVTTEDWFGHDQLVEAIELLDEVASGTESVRESVKLRKALAAYDFDLFRSMVSPDIVVIDDRQLGTGRRDLESWIESLAPPADGGRWNTVPVEILRTHRQGTRHWALTMNRVTAGDSVFELFMLTASDAGVLDTMEYFDLDDLDAAVARFDELVPAERGELSNLATRVYIDELPSAARRKDFAEVDRLVGHDLVYESLRRGVTDTGGGKQEFFQGALSWIDVGLSASFSPLAIRGDHLALVYVDFATDTGEHKVPVVGLIEVSPDARLTYFAAYDDADLTAAQMALDLRWWTQLGLRDDHPARGMHAAAYTTDPAVLAAESHPDMRFTEHRRLAFESGGHEQLTANLTALELTDQVVIPVMHRLSDDAIVLQKNEIGADGNSTDFIVVTTFRDGRAASYDTYDVDDLDAALAKYDELTGSTEPHRLQNLATRLFEVDQSIARGRALVRDDAVYEAHRRGPRGADGGKAELLAHVQSWEELGITPRNHPIAIRGDHLALGQTSYESNDSDATVTMYSLVHTDDDGLMAYCGVWDDEDLTAAQIELDRRWFDEIGLADGHRVRTIIAAAYSADPDEILAVTHPDIELVEHRALSFEGGDWRRLAENLATLDLTARVEIPVIHRVSEVAALLEKHELGPDGERSVYLIAVGLRDGLCSSYDIYDVDDLDAALARYRELTGEPAPTGPELRNAATITWVERVSPRHRASDWDGVARLLREDMVFDMQRRVVGPPGGGKQEWMNAATSWRDVGLSPTPNPIAVRGDRLALLEVEFAGDGLDDRIRVFALVEVDADGLVTYLGAWNDDDRIAAQIALDHRWGDELGFAADHPWRQVWATAYSIDADAYTAAAHPDLTYHDHRHLPFESGGRAQLGRAAPSIAAVGGHIEVPRIHRLSDRCAVADRVVVADDGERTSYLVVTSLTDRLIATIDMYGPDDLAAALARYDELMSEEPTGPATLRNLATITWTERLPALTDDDAMAAFDHWLRDDLVSEVHRRLVGAPPGGKDDLIAAAKGWRDMGMPATRTPAAVRGDRLALLQMRFTDPGSDDYVLIYSVIEVDAEGRVVYLGAWDDIDIDAAQIEMDRRWFDELGLADDHPARQLHQGLYSVDPDQIMNGAHPDIRYTEHRRLSFEGGSRAQLAENTSTMAVIDHCVVPIVHRMSELGGVLEKQEVSVGGDATTFALVIGFRDGLAGSFDLYDIDDLGSALARYDQLVREAGSTSFQLMRQLAAAIRAGDHSGARAVMSDDFVRVDHTRLNVGSDLGADDFVESQIEQWHRAHEAAIDLELVAEYDHQVALVRADYTMDDSVMPMRVVTELRDGVFARFDIYDAEQEAEARAEFERLVAAVGPPTPVERVTEVFRSTWNSGDMAALRALHHPDLEVSSHRKVVNPGDIRGDEAWDSVQAIAEFFPNCEYVPIDSPTPRIAMAHFTISNADGIGLEILGLVEIGTDTLIRRIATFDADDLDAARALLAEWVATGALPHSTPIGRVLDAFGSAWNAGDMASLGSLHDPDLRIFSNRSVVNPGNTRGEQAWESIRAMAEICPAFEAARVDSPTDQIVLIDITVANEDDIRLEFLAVLEVGADELITRIATFDPDDLDAARALLSEWAAGDTVRSGELVNDAVLAERRFVEELIRGEGIDVGPMVEPDFTFAGRQRSSAFVEGGHETWQSALDFFTESGIVEYQVDAIAIRGDSLALSEATFVLGGGDELHNFLIRELGPSGRWQHISIFDHDQLAEAVDEFEQRWLAAGGPANVIEGSRNLRHAFAVPGFDLESLTLTSDFFTVDHRLVGLGRRDRDEFIASGAGITPSNPYVSRFFAIAERGDSTVSFYEIKIERLDDDFAWHAIHVARHERAETAEIHVFAPDQFAEAHAQFDLLAAGYDRHDHGAGAANAAWAVVERFGDLWRDHDRDAVLELLADDFVITGRGTLSTGESHDRETFADLVSDPATNPDRADNRQVLAATRGDDLCLFQVTETLDEYALDILWVARTSEGRLAELIRFDADQLDEALGELDDQWVTLGGDPTLARHFGDGTRAVRTNDVGLLRSLLDDDFVSFDHRRLGLGERGPDEFAESVALMGGAGTAALVTEVIEHAGGCALLTMSVTAADGSNWNFLLLWQLSDALMARTDVFDTGQLAEAQALFDELTGFGELEA